MVGVDFIEREYPLHWYIWNNESQKLEDILCQSTIELEKCDNRGRTPLMLAVTLGHLECVRVLLNFNANVNFESSEGWTVVQEAVSTGDPILLQMVLQSHDYQRYSSRMAGVPELLQKLKDAPDFYVEMKWEFTSWVPLLSMMCPSDTYKVYKQGSNVRIDTTLLGFDHNSWQRGNKSYVFQGNDRDATMMEIDHETRQVFFEKLHRANDEAQAIFVPTEEALAQRLTTPIVTSYVDTEKISFERDRAGIWGLRSDRVEVVNGYRCKVFSASNVDWIMKSRTEHLTESDKAKCRRNKSPLQNFLNIADVEPSSIDLKSNRRRVDCNPSNIRPQDYFDKDVQLQGDIGRPREISSRVQKFKATLWLCENYPLSLPEQILPIVDLMATSSTHFAKLRNFIQMQLPAGFPVKIEIPLFHVLNARITFGNIFGLDSDVDKVCRIQEEDRLTCVLDDVLFQIPPGYVRISNSEIDEQRRQFNKEEEDELLQFAIQQSLIDPGTEEEEVDIWEALKAKKPSTRPSTPSFGGNDLEERQLQRAIQASLELYRSEHPELPNADSNEEEEPATLVVEDSEYNKAIFLSEQQRLIEEQERLEEQRLLEQVLQLSLTDK